MSTTPTTCPHCGGRGFTIYQDKDGDPAQEQCRTCWDAGRISHLERENAALKAELEQAKADRARAAMEERNKCLSEMERQKVALMVALKTLGECQVLVRNEIMVRELLDESANAWPDLLNGCVSGGGIESALTAITAALEAQP